LIHVFIYALYSVKCTNKDMNIILCVKMLPDEKLLVKLAGLFRKCRLSCEWLLN